MTEVASSQPERADRLRSRVYVCLPITDESVCRALSFAGRNLPPRNPAKYHLTLKFIHEVGEKKLAELLKALPELGVRYEPFELSLAEIGSFPDSGVVWRGVEPSVPLENLQAEIGRLVIALGLPAADYEGFNPHITLGRPQRLPPFGDFQPVSWLVDELQVRDPLNDAVTVPPLCTIRLGPASG